MVKTFYCASWNRLVSGDRLYACGDPSYVTPYKDGASYGERPFVGYFSHVEQMGEIAVIVQTTVVSNRSVVIDPIKERRQEYQDLGETYTKASDLAVCDYVDETIDKLAEVVQALSDVVADQKVTIDLLTFGYDRLVKPESKKNQYKPGKPRKRGKR